MDVNIKEKIIDTAQMLFLEKDYDSVTMRDIAGKLGISVGNLTYHYPKKEDVLMTIHDRIMGHFDSQLSQEWKAEKGIAGFFAAEYAFHHFIVNDPGFYRIYRQVINSPVMRIDYYDRHLKLFKTFFRDASEMHAEPAREEILRDAITAMSALEYHLMENGALARDFDGVFENIILSSLLFFHAAGRKKAEVDPDTPEDLSILRSAMAEGRKLSAKIYMGI